MSVLSFGFEFWVVGLPLVGMPSRISDRPRNGSAASAGPTKISDDFFDGHLGIDLRERFLAAHGEDEVLHGGGGLTLHALMRARADVRRADDVRQLEQRVIGLR